MSDRLATNKQSTATRKLTAADRRAIRRVGKQRRRSGHRAQNLPAARIPAQPSTSQCRCGAVFADRSSRLAIARRRTHETAAHP